jgi:hypothetical protein
LRGTEGRFSHADRSMPNLIVTPQDRDDIIAHILSLRRE